MLKKANRLAINEELIVTEKTRLKLLSKSDKTAVIETMSDKPVHELLKECGEIPLPPYIKTDNPNQFEDDYQTVFGSVPGAVAAPTAGRHFSTEILTQLKSKKIDIIYITLHVGLGTFNPMQSNNIYDHKMHHENYEINAEAAEKLNQAKSNKKDLYTGTTVARTLESNIKNNAFHAGKFRH